MRETQRSFRPFFIFSTLSALLILSLFYRGSNAVIAPNLMQDLRLDAEALGILGGAYFYSFALLQIPVGPMLDRIGPCMIMSSFSLVGALGAFLFAFGQSFTLALLGRILIGIGMASVLMGALKVFILRFPLEKFATLSGAIISIGTLGNIVATSPLAYLSKAIGWRNTFCLAGGITAMLAFLAFWVLGEEKEMNRGFASSPSHEQEMGIFQSIRLVLGSLSFWQIGTIAFFRYGTFVSLQGLWLGPYLIDAEGYSPVQAGNVLIFLAIGTIIGGPIAGRLSDRTFRSTKSVALWGLGLYSLTLFPLVGILKIQSPFWYGLIFFLIGFFNGFGMLIFPHAKELFPISISGTVMTLVNFFSISGGAVLMPVLGKIIKLFPLINNVYPARAYHISFFICFLGVVGSLIFYAFSRTGKTFSL
jgi:MFS family permease